MREPADCIFHEAAYHIYVRYREPRLFKLAKNGEWERLAKRCTSHPKKSGREARFVHKYPPCDTALHRVLRAPPPEAGHSPQASLFLDHAPKDDLDRTESKTRALSALISANAEATLVQDCLGRSPLQLSVMDISVNMRTIEFLLYICPSSASFQDIEGRTALHHACMNPRMSANTLQKLIACYPDAASRQDSQGRTPLHYACMHVPVSHGAENVRRKTRLLLRANPQATRSVDNEGMTPLHHLCLYIRELYNFRYVNEFYQLDKVLSDSLFMMQMILLPCPAVALWEDCNKETPFSIICDLYQEAVRTVVPPAKNVSKMRELIPNWGQLLQIVLTLSHAAAGIEGANGIVKDRELHDTLSAIKFQISLGCGTPKHSASDFDPVAVAVLDLFPAQVFEDDEEGNLPLHIAASIPSACESEKVSIVESLVALCPDAARSPNKEGKLPFAIACESGKNWEAAVKWILRAYPKGLAATEFNVAFLPNLLAKVGRDLDLTSLYLIARDQPALAL